MGIKISDIIKNRILGSEKEQVFSIADFTDIAAPKTVSKTLSRLEDENVVRKVVRGVYSKSSEDTPNPNKAARAIAKLNGWQIAPSGKTALYLVGLIDEEPTEWTYVSDSTYRDYYFSDYKVSFTKTNGLFNIVSENTIFIMQIIKAYGTHNIPEFFNEKIRNYFSEETLLIVSKEIRNVPQRIAKIFLKSQLKGTI